MNKIFKSNDISSKILRLIFKVAVLIFAVGGVLYLFSMVATWFFINKTSAKSENEISSYTKQILEEETMGNLNRVTKLRARLLDSELEEIADDTEHIANGISVILNSPENYLPRRLPNTNDGKSHLGEPYIYYTNELKANLTPEIENEVYLVSNIADEMLNMCNVSYSDMDLEMFIGFENGYMICLDKYADVDAYSKYSKEIYDNYDPRKRVWYETAKKNNKLTFTDVYFSKGRKAITCTIPIYNGEKFIGVAGIEMGTDFLDKIIVRNSLQTDVINFVINKDGKIMLSSQKSGIFAENSEKDLRESDEKELSEIAKRMTTDINGVGSIKIGEEEYFLSYRTLETTNWSLGRLLIKAEVLSPVNTVQSLILTQMEELASSVGKIFWIMIGISIIIVLILIFRAMKYGKKLSYEFVKPIQELTAGVHEIASENFNKKLDIKTGDEIENLAVCFNEMTSKLNEYMTNLKQTTAEKERSLAELEIAKNIQQSMLPREFDFSHANFEIFASMNAAKEVGGDFYDFYLVDERHLIITVADVSGKGVPAALFMVIAKTMLKNFAQMMIGNDDLGSLVTFTNQKLCEGNDEMMFVTLFAGILDLETGKFTYVNAGHNPPLVYRKSVGKFEYLLTEKRNQVLGLMDDAEYEQEILNLSAEDILFVYTDGVTEAFDEKSEEYGEERLIECLNSLRAEKISVQEIIKSVNSSVKAFVGGATQSDDITMLAIKNKNFS